MYIYIIINIILLYLLKTYFYMKKVVRKQKKIFSMQKNIKYYKGYITIYGRPNSPKIFC